MSLNSEGGHFSCKTPWPHTYTGLLCLSEGSGGPTVRPQLDWQSNFASWLWSDIGMVSWASHLWVYGVADNTVKGSHIFLLRNSLPSLTHGSTRDQSSHSEGSRATFPISPQSIRTEMNSSKHPLASQLCSPAYLPPRHYPPVVALLPCTHREGPFKSPLWWDTLGFVVLWGRPVCL